MTSEEKHKYIFEDTSFEGRPRFKWITDCLLGDIRTFLDGIENVTDNKDKFAGKLPRGGGNLTVPILINTALELVSELYAGKTKHMLRFSMDLDSGLEKAWEEFKKNLKNSSNKFKEISKKKGVSLPKNGKIAVTIDEVKKEGEKINIYETYNATDNVSRFTKRFVPDIYKSISLLLWDGIRNGLIHTFYPIHFKFQGKLLFRINDTELEKELDNCIIPEKSKNEFKAKGFLLSEKLSVIKEKDDEWKITDKEREKIHYIVRKEDEKLNIYQEEYIQFQFFVEDRDFPSHIKKANDTILITINVFEWYRILEKAIEDYRDELEYDEALQDNFIKAWSSMEQYIEAADFDQSKEVRALIDYLASRYFFSMDARLEEDMNKGIITEKLKKEFKINEIELSKNLAIEKIKDNEWEINDHENKEVYIIKKEDGKLNTYRLNHVAPLLEDLNLKRGLTYDLLRTYSLLKLKRS